MSYNPYMGYMFQQPQVMPQHAPLPVAKPAVHATPDRTEGPGLMQHQKEKYGAHLFAKNEDGSYTCFFAGCGKQLSANFSRHISRHEQDGDAIDSTVQVKGTKAGTIKQQPQTPVAPMTPMTPITHMNMNPMTPMTPIPMTPLTPMATVPMVIPPAMPLPFINNPMAAAMAHTQTLIQPTMSTPLPQTPAPAPAPVTPHHPKRQSHVPTTPAPILPSQQEMESKGIPFQVCQHPNHDKWWGTSPALPLTEFYNRASKCKKCYIRQQQDSKRARIQTGNTMSQIMSTVNHSTASAISNDDMPMTPKISSKKAQQQQQMNMNMNMNMGVPMNLNMGNMNMNMGVGMGNMNMNMGVGNMNMNMNMGVGMNMKMAAANVPQSSVYVKQYQQINQQQQHQLEMAQMEKQKLQQQLQAHQSLVQNNLIRLLPRPKREPSPMEINRLQLEKLKEIVNILIKDTRSKWFREPVDPIKMHVPDYHDIIKQPRDLGTIEKSLAAGKFAHYTQVDTDFRLVFKNAMTYNEDDTDVYESAEELEKVYDELFKQALLESEAEAHLQAEIIKDICALCRGHPVPYKRPPTQNGEGASSPLQDETTPVPLLLCEGSCLRAFHLHCLGLPVDTKPPWMCEECHQGRPVLHYDDQKQEYFYYYYEGVSCDEEQDNNEFEGNDEAVVSNLGMLAKEEKISIRQEEESHRVRDMYFDPVWCMWRCKSRVVMKQREDRQKPILLSAQSKVKRTKKKRGRKPKGKATA